MNDFYSAIMKRGSTISPFTGATFVPAIGRSNSIWARSRLRFATNWRSTCGNAGNFGLVPSNSSATVMIWSLGNQPCASSGQILLHLQRKPSAQSALLGAPEFPYRLPAH